MPDTFSTWGATLGEVATVLCQALPSAHLEGIEMLAARVAAVPSGIYDAVTVGDLATLVAVETKFDALVMGELIERVPYSALEQFISSARQILVPVGRLFLAIPNPHFLIIPPFP